MSTKVLIVGRSGRMGREIDSVAGELGLQVVGGIGREGGGTSKWLSANQKPDVVIDFSLPPATADVASACAEAGVPLVSGVTGLSELEKAALKKASEKIPVLYSANMSVGIQMLAKALDALKGVEGFDLAIEESHHRMKRDRPSGTAILLDDELQKRIGRRATDVVSFRGGGIIGTHRVHAMSDSEILVFEHQALNRSVFARGACRAARWIVGKSPGMYSLADTLSP